MSKNLDRYWQIEYQLQLLWEIPHEARDYAHISVLNKQQQDIKRLLEVEELRGIEDMALTNH
jgi:hypothetical protein